MPDQPLAYFLTFTTYGTRLHGDDRGSVDRDHNGYGTPLLPPDPFARNAARRMMTQEPYLLDEPRRNLVRDAIVEECRFRGWDLLALHVRTNHVHVVVTAERAPDFVTRACKANASKRLNRAGFECRDRHRWTDGGSTKYLWREDAVEEKVAYTLHEQGEPMAVYDPSDNRSRSASDGPH